MRKFFALTLAILAILAILGLAAPASAATSTVNGVTLSCPDIGHVGQPLTCTGSSPYGAFRMYGGPINRLGEGFGTGTSGTYTPRAPGYYTARYSVGAACVGSPNRACPIYVYVGIPVS